MKKKRGQRFNLHINNELKEIFIGHHTLFSVLGFIVGGILIGETIKEVLHMHIGLAWTLAVGLILLLLTGMTLHKFSDRSSDNSIEDVIDELV
ncbi:MAG: hypothetical protein ACJAV6_000251 [Candidatus Paceibacteria bacterium]|jgi:hypothetical protein